MFPSVNRLRNEKDIKTLFAKGRSVFDVTLGIRFAPNNLPVTRFTVVVGTKISKRAVVRNKIKRRIRGIVEKRLLEIKPGFDVLFLVKKETIDQTHKQLVEQIERMFKRAKLV
ncbi:ribonuclease P protein component [Candidatus Uhrbacteria bacterium RIFCSPHIGHO2_02_FULL_47_44]|uniref:Ribonuclease P protein component n=1 Tax=Candidatus Uhrbacteria bacterium RIFCSPLOWO2_02_FULL_48_18 TaxID=1802408 RepID=A0A1F7V8E7_9BACT|nr:MAG: ribonuclease P protein component [Candidatus Uhrbacteria bacterium RIFCSPHIGHO2_01_FULL_47_10]OGL71211.1 MAG: ribonuclease P protein component [Candidatus Uhrbacteria bacterium RIFCSPHIGHO2_02_FULL_47_44]OGL77281.1 MAG: ribonuclease P protein component [Candidatus Uhrbacteria bacterium RIFCSPHIGHO2_12_FULL_47_12]OGL80507.1 MAG: ribonuclease P protein component [Candidatus Uhrbacteria bacterium RIFCSPLOWO2_01_FULL_47_17]OGL86367.1 MAG: ribonuclease P protein component [Candidatus Uhrbact